MNNVQNKLKFLVLTSLLCLPFGVSAQDFTYGAKAGVNIATLNFDDNSSTKSFLGVHVGAFGNYAVNEEFAIQPELFFSTGGTKYSYNYTYNPSVDMEMGGNAAIYKVSGKIKTSSITLPVMLQYNIWEALFIEAGPQFNFLLSIKESVDGGADDDIKESYKTGTFGYGVGIGYDLRAFAPGLKVGLRFTGDFSDMNKEEIGAGSLKSQMFQLGVSYAFIK